MHVLLSIVIEMLEQKDGGDQPTHGPVALPGAEDGSMGAMMEHHDLEHAETGGRGTREIKSRRAPGTGGTMVHSTPNDRPAATRRQP